MAPYMFLCFTARSAHVWTQGGHKKVKEGPLFIMYYSSDQKTTATDRMNMSDINMWEEVLQFFLLYSEVKFLTRF